MTPPEHFLFLAALAGVDDYELDFERATARYALADRGLDIVEELQLWAGSPAALIDIYAYAAIFTYWLDEEAADTLAVIRPVWDECVAEQPILANEWVELIPAFGSDGRLIIGRV